MGRENFYITSIIYPLVSASLIVMLCIIFFGWHQIYFAIFFGIFAIVSKIFEFVREKSLQKNILIVHRDYALKDIEKVESFIQNDGSKNEMKLSLQHLENKLLCMFKCCTETNLLKIKLKDLRGNLGNFRTQLLKPGIDKNVVFVEIANELESLRPYLEEI